MPACHMSDDRKIVAQSRQKFHKLPSYSEVTEPIFTTFSYNVEAFLPRLTRTYKTMLYFVSERQQRVKVVHLDVCKKPRN